MGSVGAPELIVIFLVALIVLGPDRLPKMARQMGRAMAEFKRVTSGFEDEVRRAMNDTTDGSSAASGSSTAPPADEVPPPAADAPVAPATRAVLSPDELPPPPDDPSRN